MLIASAVCMMGFGIYSRRFSSNPASLPYQLLMFSAAFWSLLYALDLSTYYLPTKIFWQEMRFIFLPFLSVLELWLVLAFLRRDEWLSGWKLGFLCIIPCISVFLALTSEYHTLFRYNYELIETGLLPILKVSTGPFYTIYLVYTYCIITVALMALIIIRDETHRIYTIQRFFLFLALFFPVMLAFLFDIGVISISGINPTPAFLWIMGILYGIALFHYKLFDVIPIARSSVIDEMGMPMMVLNKEGKIIDINPASHMLFGFQGKKVIGQPLSDLVPDWLELIQFSSSIQHGRQEITRVQNDTILTYEARIDTIFSGPQQPEARVILLTDITGQKNLEKELRESEKRWKSIVDGAPFPVVITRISDNMILLVNKRTTEQFNIPSDELVGKVTERFYADIETRNKIIEILNGQDIIDDVMMEMISPDGRKFWVYASVRKIKYLGEDAFFISFADVTLRKMLEDTLREKNAELELKSETLKETNKKLNLLSSITRHDILNNVQVIMLAIDLLTYPPDKSEFIKNISFIRDAGMNIQGLIEFTAEYQTLGQTKPEWQNISTLIHDPLMIRLLSGISLDTPPMKIEIFADSLLKKVFYNLADNSIRHGAHVQKIRIFSEYAENGLLIIYEDDGVGIPLEEKKKVFSRGYGKHTGLGLFLIREILEITKMTINECGVPGKGVRFEIFVPDGKYRIITLPH